MQHPTPRVGDVEPLARAGDTDVCETPLFFHLVGLTECADVREDAVLEPHEHHHRELEALRRVQRHEYDLRLVAVDLVDIGDEADLFEELVDRVEVTRHTDQLGEVLEAAFGFDGTFGLQFGGVPTAFEHRFEHRPRTIDEPRHEIVDECDERGDAPNRGAAYVELVDPAQRLEEGDPVGARPRVDLAHRAVADAALRHVENPLDIDLVGQVRDHAQIGQRFLDLAAVVELGAADHLVGDAHPHEVFLEHPALRIGAIEDRRVAPAVGPAVVQARQLVGHPLRLVALLVGEVAHDGRAGSLIGPQLLRLATRVVRDDGVRGIEDGLRRPVVLLEEDDARVGERLLELEDVANVGTTKLIYRLIAVADHERVAVTAGEQHHQLVLHAVGVLVLVDEHVPKSIAIRREDIGVQAEELDRVHEQIVEVHRAGLQEAGLVFAVHLADALLVDDLGALGELLDAHVVVLGRADRGVHRTRWELLGVDVEIA